MKHSETHSGNRQAVGAALLAILTVATLSVTAAALWVTESMSLWAGLTQVAFSLAVYSLIVSIRRRTALMTLLLIPMMAFNGFQIVLLYLYGGSIIGVDMFLNVVTTNFSEATELLANLLIAIGVILILYIPPIVGAIVLLCRHRALCSSVFARRLRIFGCAAALVFAASLTLVKSLTPEYRIADDLYPVNIFNNLRLAFVRSSEVSNYATTSEGYTYDASMADTISTDAPRIIVAVIGETSRGDNWSLLGYERPTNPRLSATENLTVFTRATSQSNTTHKSVPMMLSPLTAENFDSIAHVKSFVTAFNEAGYRTAFISNQRPNRSYTEFFSHEADTTIYLPGEFTQTRDAETLPLIASVIAESDSNQNVLIVVHAYGSHFKYSDRYPREAAVFGPDETADANVSTRPRLINAFDNTIAYTDAWLADIIDLLKATEKPAAMIYAPDHGEDIFDDERERFLHASPRSTSYQLYVPMIVWTSDSFNALNPAMIEALGANSDKRVSTTDAYFHTLVDLGGLSTFRYNADRSVASPSYTPGPSLYVDDHNRSLPIERSGLSAADLERMRSKGLIANQY